MEKKAYLDKAEAQVKEWTAKIDQLKAKAEQVSADTKIEYQNQIKQLNAQTKAVQDKLKEIRDAGEDSWETMKSDVERTTKELKALVESAISKF
jgi:hypothetical protein